MDQFKNLLGVADRLLGEGGCPWDREQTLATLQPYLLEETYELLEAIDLGDGKKISEELGDVLYALVFIARLNEKVNGVDLNQSVRTVAEKLVRRHPHVFGDQKISSSQDVVDNWEVVKKREGKKSPIENIPPHLPALARAQKIIHKMKIKERIGDDLGQRLWDLVSEANEAGVDAESALRRTCLAYEEKHRR